jgi:hypothetical protein
MSVQPADERSLDSINDWVIGGVGQSVAKVIARRRRLGVK